MVEEVWISCRIIETYDRRTATSFENEKWSFLAAGNRADKTRVKRPEVVVNMLTTATGDAFNASW